MSTTEAAIQRGRGRPRDPRKDALIREAAWRILAEKGFEGLTFEAVAETAGCSRATLYRRFSSRVELVAAILDETSRSVEPELASDVPPREALIAHTTAAVAYLSGNRGQAVMRLGATTNSPELVDALLAHAENERHFYRREFTRLEPNASTVDVDFALHTLLGAVTYHVAMLQRPLSARRICQLVDGSIGLLAEAP